MYSELIVLVIAGKGDLEKTWQILDKSQGGQLFMLVDMVLIYRDTTGKVSFQAARRDFDGPLNGSRRLAGAFAKAIFGITRAEGRRRLVEAGMDPHFLKGLDQALISDRSAYLIHVPGESLLDTHRYLEILGQQPGDIYHTTFPPRVEEALLNRDI